MSEAGARRGKRIARYWKSHVRPFWRAYEVPVFILMGAAAILLGFIGYTVFFRAQGVNRPVLDIAFSTIQLFRMMFFQAGPFPWELELARWLAAAVILYAAVRVISAIFYDQLQLLLLRWLASDHVVICGLGQAGDALSDTFSAQGYRVAVVEKDTTKETARVCRDRGVTLVAGSAADPQTLLLARVEKARYLISVLGDDGANVEVALTARRLVEEKGEKSRTLTCYVQVADRQLCNMLKANYEFNKDRWTNCRLEFFNAFDSGAKAMIRAYPLTVEGPVAIIGMGRFGESLLLQVATDRLSIRPENRIRIAVVDRGAGAVVASLLARYPLIGATCAVEAFDLSPDMPAFYAAPFLITGAARIYVCLESDRESLSAALVLSRQAREHGAQIVVCMGQSTGLSRLIRGESETSGIFAFEMREAIYRPESLLGGARETLAMAMHEDYRQNQQKSGATPATNSSMVPWEALPESLRESNRHSADAALVKLSAASCGIELLTDAAAVDFQFTPSEIERMAVIEHERWLDERTSQGWKYAPVKDIDKKLSPYLVPWEQLSEEIREYDRNVVRGMPRFLAKAGFQVYRLKKDERSSAIEEMKTLAT